MNLIIIGAISAFLTVALGAFGAHALKSMLDEYSRGIYETAVHYQMYHSLALIAAGTLQLIFKESSFHISGWAFIAGIILFSGSLYLLAVTSQRWLGILTPVGGVAFLFGWGWLVYQLFRLKG